MSTANKQVSGEKLQKTLMEFARENEKMTMGQEIMEDALIDAVSGAFPFSLTSNDLNICDEDHIRRVIEAPPCIATTILAR